LGENSPKLVTLLGVFVCETIADKSRPKWCPAHLFKTLLHMYLPCEKSCPKILTSLGPLKKQSP
jgi:hypothetical protein